MNEDKGLTPLEAEMLAGLSAFADALESGEPIEKRFTVRTMALNSQPRAYGPEDVKQVRRLVKASQALLARFLGVSVKSVCAWEQGKRKVPAIACRFMDEVVANPLIWEQRLREATSAGPRPSVGQ